MIEVVASPKQLIMGSRKNRNYMVYVRGLLGVSNTANTLPVRTVLFTYCRFSYFSARRTDRSVPKTGMNVSE